MTRDCVLESIDFSGAAAWRGAGLSLLLGAPVTTFTAAAAPCVIMAAALSPHQYGRPGWALDCSTHSQSLQLRQREEVTRETAEDF